jgi:hypothetical protein
MGEAIPLHLHLSEINLEKKFKKQKFTIRQELPLFDYFKQTMDRLNLKFPQKSSTSQKAEAAELKNAIKND